MYERREIKVFLLFCKKLTNYICKFPYNNKNKIFNGGFTMAENNYQIASITKTDEDAIKKSESDLKKETGKDFIMIAWEKK